MADCRIGAETAARIAAAWPDLLNEIAAGAEVRKALSSAGITRGMIRAYLAETPGARAQWDDAREASADAFMDEALAVAMDNISKDDASHARTRIDTLKWAARIRNPRLYGDKAQLDVNVRTVDLTRIIEAANARLAAAQAPRVVEGEVMRAALPASLKEIL